MRRGGQSARHAVALASLGAVLGFALVVLLEVDYAEVYSCQVAFVTTSAGLQDQVAP